MQLVGFDELRWPVLVFGEPNCVMMCFASNEYFASGSAKALKGWRALRDYYLVDSEGIVYRLQHPKFRTEPTLFQKLMGTELPISWQLERGKAVDVEKVRELVLDNFNSYESYWEGCDVDWLKRQVLQARTIPAIMDIFRPTL